MTNCELPDDGSEQLPAYLFKLSPNGSLERLEIGDPGQASFFEMSEFSETSFAFTFTANGKRGAALFNSETRLIEPQTILDAYDDERDLGLFSDRRHFTLLESHPNLVHGFEVVEKTTVQRLYTTPSPIWKTDTVFTANRYAPNRLRTVRSVTKISGAEDLFSIKEQTFDVRGEDLHAYGTTVYPFFERYVVVNWPLGSPMLTVATINAKSVAETNTPTVVHQFTSGKFGLTTSTGGVSVFNPLTSAEIVLTNSRNLDLFVGDFYIYLNELQFEETIAFTFFNAVTGAQTTLSFPGQIPIGETPELIPAGNNRIAILFGISNPSGFSSELRLVDLTTLSIQSLSYRTEGLLRPMGRPFWFRSNLYFFAQ